ncbi:MAG: hypothetical protein R6U66_09560 [Bacteroidales bacterium]
MKCKKHFFAALMALGVIAGGCSTGSSPADSTATIQERNIAKNTVKTVIQDLQNNHAEVPGDRIADGVKHVASLWRASDGDAQAFKAFCEKYFVADEQERFEVFKKISNNMESLWGYFNKLNLDLQKNMHEDIGTFHAVDQLFAGYSPGAHLTEDFYNNKIAFVVALNFPPVSLEEKEAEGADWDTKQWAYARLGDVFTARVPASLAQAYNETQTKGDIYIADYNIYMGHLINEEGERLFPEDMVLLSHWNLRDEIKSNYADAKKGLEKQDMVYSVMKHIIHQTIPSEVINSGAYDWNPAKNKVYKEGAEVSFKAEADIRYQQIVSNFQALQKMDPYYPELDTYIKRKFSGDMEIPQPEVETLFDEFLSSPQVQEVATLIKERLGRDLRPYDIWYDGFKSRSAYSGDMLKTMTQKRYPNAQALENDLPRILKTLGWEPERADFIASKVEVDPARGSGHAWGASMKEMKAHLRTRVGDKGMDYKGYNIAVHEFGHNVEQTISLHDVDYYMMNGVPNTAFTEALAFIFQKRDLELLGLTQKDPLQAHLQTLDTFWSLYEIMGVSMVDMRVWKWLYAHPEATKSELKEAVIDIANEVWNSYYAPVFGMEDEPVLAIYSHMVASPLYLSAYAFGHLIDFQIEQHLKGKDFSNEVDRIWSQGKLTPQYWMQQAVGEKIANSPILSATDEALKAMK